MTCNTESWMSFWNTQENAATFVSHNCVHCRRYWNPELREAMKPICILNSYMPTACGLKFGFQDPVLHLTMDDNEACPKVRGVRQLFDQTFLDPAGDPNTDAHSCAGHINNALSFDGVDDRIALTDISNQPYLEANTDFTFAVWLKANSPSALLNLIPMGNGEGGSSGFSIHFKLGFYLLRINFFIGAVNYSVYYQTISAVDANWHHFAIVRQGYIINLYIDGVLVTTATNAIYANKAYTTGQSFNLGCNHIQIKYAPCSIDDFRLYTIALTTAEIVVLAT